LQLTKEIQYNGLIKSKVALTIAGHILGEADTCYC